MEKSCVLEPYIPKFKLTLFPTLVRGVDDEFEEETPLVTFCSWSPELHDLDLRAVNPMVWPLIIELKTKGEKENLMNQITLKHRLTLQTTSLDDNKNIEHIFVQ